MLIWVMFNCRYKLDQIKVRLHKLEGAEEKKRVMNYIPVDWIGNPGDWIRLQMTKFPSVDYTSGRNSIIQNQEGSIDWM
jgi:hypothetical protein